MVLEELSTMTGPSIKVALTMELLTATRPFLYGQMALFIEDRYDLIRQMEMDSSTLKNYFTKESGSMTYHTAKLGNLTVLHLTMMVGLKMESSQVKVFIVGIQIKPILAVFLITSWKEEGNFKQKSTFTKDYSSKIRKKALESILTK